MTTKHRRIGECTVALELKSSEDKLLQTLKVEYPKAMKRKKNRYSSTDQLFVNATEREKHTWLIQDTENASRNGVT